MGFVAVFVLFIFAMTQATQYDCNNSNYYMAEAATKSMDDHQRLQYCLIDNCTIMRIDTGQQLDIAYTTQSHLVVTPADGQTSMLISKNKSRQLCSPPDPVVPHYSGGVSTVTVWVRNILVALTAILSGYTVALFLLFK